MKIIHISMKQKLDTQNQLLLSAFCVYDKNASVTDLEVGNFNDFFFSTCCVLSRKQKLNTCKELFFSAHTFDEKDVSLTKLEV